MELVAKSRAQILDKFVKPGETWARARHGYLVTLSTQTGVVNMMANWLGGSFVNRDHKGDPGDRSPLQCVPADAQRAALSFVIENSFDEKAFGLSPELLARMSVERWYEDGSAREEPIYQVHDRLAGVQASVMTMLLNPTTLRRVYDAEFVQAPEVDALTLPELLDTISRSVWSEIGFDGNGGKTREAGFKSKAFSVRSPAITSLRRNLQHEHLQRMIDLALQKNSNASSRSIALLARSTLDGLGKAIDASLAENLDAYTRSHLADARARITKALDASYTYASSAPPSSTVIFGRGREDAEPR
jgi:hypothetical protein